MSHLSDQFKDFRWNLASVNGAHGALLACAGISLPPRAAALSWARDVLSGVAR